MKELELELEVAGVTFGVGDGDAVGIDLGNKLIPMSNTTDNTIKMITAFLLLMMSFISFFCYLYK